MVFSGANGSGKTSLLRLIGGFLHPTEGEIAWRGMPIQEDPEAYREHLQYIGHADALYEELTVGENLALWAALTGTAELVPSALAFFHLTGVCDAPCRTLSQGWRRRVAIARLMLDPAPLWLLDEPLVHLDADTADRALSLVAAHCDRGGMAILTAPQGQRLPFGMVLDIEEFN